MYGCSNHPTSTNFNFEKYRLMVGHRNRYLDKDKDRNVYTAFGAGNSRSNRLASHFFI